MKCSQFNAVIDKELAKLIMNTIPLIMQNIDKHDTNSEHLLVMSHILNLPFDFNTETDSGYYPKQPTEVNMVEICTRKARFAATHAIDWNSFSSEEILEITENDEKLLSYIMESLLIDDVDTVIKIANQMESVLVWKAAIISCQVPHDIAGCLKMVALYNDSQVDDETMQAEFSQLANQFPSPFFVNVADAKNQPIVIAAIEQLEVEQQQNEARSQSPVMEYSQISRQNTDKKRYLN